MSSKLFLPLFLCIIFHVSLVKAQQLNGTVLDQVSNEPIAKATINNLTSKLQVQSDFKGKFTIQAKEGDLLSFQLLGYQTDTVMLTSTKPFKHYLLSASNTLKTVHIAGIADYKRQYAQTLNKANPVLLTQGRGLLFYPTSYFSREGKQARQFKKMIKKEQKELPIDKRFNSATITAILPIKQPELDAFIILYRPKLDFVLRASDDDFKFYLFDAYNQFKKLPAEKKVLPLLGTSTAN